MDRTSAFTNDASQSPLHGILHVYVAFDWGEEIDLGTARQLIPSERHSLPRKSRTPASISYEPRPLKMSVGAPPLDVPELAGAKVDVDVTIFDFAAVSVGIHVPYRLLPAELVALAGRFVDPALFVSAARQAVEPVFQALSPTIKNANWAEMWEEYFVFQITPADADQGSPEQQRQTVRRLLDHEQAWLAGLVRLETAPLSPEEVAEALRLRLSYGLDDLLVVDWGAAAIIDRDCDEILETLAFGNLQLLEFREIDRRLDTHLATSYQLLDRLAQSGRPFWRSHSRPLRKLGELQFEANEMLDRTTNVLKLIGDPYLARVYRLLVTRFHLDTWGESIHRSLDVLENVHQVVADQGATYRGEWLEIMVIFLITAEIIISLAKH